MKKYLWVLAGASINDAAVHDRFWAEDLVYTSSRGLAGYCHPRSRINRLNQ